MPLFPCFPRPATCRRMADDQEWRRQTERTLEQIAYARVQADVHWIQILTRLAERIEQEASTIADRKVLADEIRDMAEPLRKDFRVQILTRIAERIEQEAATIADRKVLADEIRDMADRLRKDFRVQLLTRTAERIEQEAATIADRKVLADEIRDIADRLRQFWIEQDQARQKR